MPGLSQLKQFNKDILSLGNEVSFRAARGEKVVRVPIPENVADVNDADDFIMGMPEIQAIKVEDTVDDDLSDITQMLNPSNDSTPETSEAMTATPDLSDLLSPAVDDGEDGMPDLSMFDDVEPEPEPEPEAPSIADMGLSDLLGDFASDSAESAAQNDPLADMDMEDFSGGFGDADYTPVDPLKRKDPELQNLDDDFGSTELSELLGDSAADDLSPLEDLTSDLDSDFDLDTPADIPELAEDLDSPADDLESFDLEEATPNGGSLTLENEPASDLDFSLDDNTDNIEDFSSDLSDLNMDDLGEGADLTDSLDLGDGMESLDGDLNLGDGMDLGDSLEAPVEDFDLGDSLDLGEGMDLGDGLEAPVEDLNLDGMDLGDGADLGDSLEAPAEDFDLGDSMDLGDGADLGDGLEAPVEDLDFGDSTDLGLDDLGDFDTSDDELSPEESAELAGGTSDFADNASELPDIDSMDSMDDLGDLNTDSDADFSVGDTADLGLDDLNFDEGEAPSATDEISDISFDDDTASSDGDTDFSMDDMGDMDFDTSEMDNFIPETDAGINGNGEFELGNADDFAFEGSEFEIPGFSDVDTAKEEKSGPILPKNLKGKKGPEEDLPPNTLTEAQYKTFLKNLSEYPLNVRLAFEELIVKDEYTDDAEFEIVEKILNKAPARQVASALERMMDISIPVPRDFEHRTAEEYEAYKRSLSYQLKNKIIPAIFIGMVCIAVGFGLYQFGNNCIYKPLKANSLYKQGYVLLQADEYPQSEMKFEEATSFRLSKKWFFEYARGYRTHKQYIRAERMYQNILNHFNHDKQAGLEYADMELSELANYESAENIVRRQILDYHVNDKDGILLLGDVYLEWATEKDSEKFDMARQQYASLIQLYGSNFLYESRMLRYFIRTNNLRQVLNLKEMFVAKDKSLSGEDCAELSGFLLDKLYGPLAPTEEYMRSSIEDVLLFLNRAVKLSPSNPIAHYNIGRYFVETDENEKARTALERAITNFKNTDILKRRDLYKYIDSYRLLGEEHNKIQEYLRSQEYFTDGIELYQTEHEASGLEGNQSIGVLYSDLADINYFISGDYDQALDNYTKSVDLGNDNSEIRYRIGYMQYKKNNYADALGSFMKAGEAVEKQNNLLLAMANTLSLRGDDYAAMGYYDNLISRLNTTREDRGILLPQANKGDHETVEQYLYAANNYGVTLYRLAKRTGNSNLNAQAIAQFTQSLRAWDSLTRNQSTMVRMEGSNLAEINISYITHPITEFEPAIYTEIPKTLRTNEGLKH